MPNIIKSYIKFIDYISLKTGRATMYLVFVMMFILILSFVTRNIINIPLIWIIEMAQFIITAYYILGGSYSMITDDHVRMDLFYGKLSEKGKAKDGGDRIRPGTKKADAYCARSAKIKKCKNPPCANTLSRKKWKCRGSKSMRS